MSFFKDYFAYVGKTEAPKLYHRWSSISMLGALLGRKVWYPFGHGRIYPNQYLMLMGSPGTRKGTAIGIAEKLLKDVGYNCFAPDRVSKERFLMEMKPRVEIDFNDLDLTSITLEDPFEIYAVADEFTDFAGPGNMEFLTMLTKLWDNKGSYKHPKIHGKSIEVDKPTVNIIAGNTAQGLALAIPTEALGNGFMSRVIFIHSDPTGKKITFPEPVDMDKHAIILERLKEIELLEGEMDSTPDAKAIMDRMYKEYTSVDDHRFKHYGTRRFTHLLKLCIILAASENSMTITEQNALDANTILYYTELRMPKALGEYGKSRYSDTSGVILDFLQTSTKPYTASELFKIVSKDLNKISDLLEILKNLKDAEKVQVINVGGKQGYMPLVKETKRWDPTLLREEFLTDEELM